ncbi:hypothetical protein D3C78_1854400 [compost metagenome]
MLNINLLFGIAGERNLQLAKRAGIQHPLPVRLIEKVGYKMAVSIEQPCFPFRSKLLSFLQESAERGNACARTNHDNRS